MRATRIYMRFPNETAKAVTLSYDDGSEQDIRLVSLLGQYHMKATFNISAGLYSPEGKQFKEGSVCRRMTRKAAIRLYQNSGHEVAAHGYSHPMLEQMPPSRVALELLEDRRALERDFGVPVRGMAYPFGSYSPAVIETLKSVGIVYSRTTSATRKFDLPTDWYKLSPTCKHTDGRLMELAEAFVGAKVDRAPMLFYLWGHSFEFEADRNWDVIENFCAYMGDRADIWYATNLQIYDYVQAYQRLIWTADARAVYNPSVQPVSFLYHTIEENGEAKKTYTVGAGETLMLQ